MQLLQQLLLGQVRKIAKERAMPYAKKYGRKLGRWCLTHKAMVLIGALVLYILVSQLSVDRRIAAALTGFGRSPTSGQEPPELQPTLGLGGIPIDDTASYPEQLDTDKIRGLVVDVDRLERTMKSTIERIGQANNLEGDLLEEPVVQKLWQAMEHGGFRDKQLPLDWYQCIRSDVNIIGQIDRTALNLAQSGAYYVSEHHLQTVRARVIGGKPTLADMEFLRLTQAWVDEASKTLDEVLPRLQQIKGRIAAEFRPEFQPQTTRPPQPGGEQSEVPQPQQPQQSNPLGKLNYQYFR